MSNELKFLLSWKSIPHFWIISVRRASLIFELFQYDELRYCPESIF